MKRDTAETGSAEPEKPLGRDERVSFYPMDPEEVLRKLLRTPPPRGQDKPVRDKGEASPS